MDWQPWPGGNAERAWGTGARVGKRWVAHVGHLGTALPLPGPHRRHGHSEVWTDSSWERKTGEITLAPRSTSRPDPGLLTLDGSRGEGGGQILRTALTLSLLLGRPFRLVKIRANREKPGLRPQHLTAVRAAASLGRAEVSGDSVGSSDLTFRPGEYTPGDLSFDIGTAGASALVLQTLHLPLALRTEEPVRLTLTGGTFNTKAPSFPFLATTWRAHLASIGAPLAVAMPQAGFYPRGGGQLNAWIEPARLRPLTLEGRGRLLRITGEAGVAGLRAEIADRMRARALARLSALGVVVTIDRAEWSALSPGAAIRLTLEHEGTPPATFVALGERGKPAEAVADEAVDELIRHESAPDSAIDPHSADQLLVPLALTPGPSAYTVSEITEHLRTNVETIRHFLDRPILVQEATETRPARVIIPA
ncbi:MAG: RNA 3'-terminal phosphate cyclase [Isosphaeraceae bacterium]